jgi:hypothetical protein
MKGGFNEVALIGGVAGTPTLVWSRRGRVVMSTLRDAP